MKAATFQELIDAGLLRVSDGYRAKNSELGGDGPVFLRGAYLQDNGFDISDPDRFSRMPKSGFGDKVAKTGDTVITTKGNSTGRVGYVNANVEGAVYSPHLSYWRSLNHERIWPRFLHYWSTGCEFQNQLFGFAFQTDMAPYLSLRDQMFLKIVLPPIEEQREIAAVLGALDDKIELNRKTAATLEAMARALYRSWFVDFDPVHAKSQGRPPAHMDPATAALFPDTFGEDGLPEGWRNGTLGDVARNVRDQIQPSEVDAETPYIGLEHIPRRALSISDWGTAEKVSSAKTAMRRGQFLFGKLRPYFHKVGLVPADGICSTDILVIEARANHLRALVANVISSDEFVSNADSSSSGTRMPRANWRDMARFEIALPNDNVARAFSREVNPMHERLLSIIEENRTLATLRDTLLPRLMSGDLRVGEAREQVEDVA